MPANKPAGRGRLPSEDPSQPQHGPEREDRANPDPASPDPASRLDDRRLEDEQERRLLAAFRDGRDPDAFDELVRRTESRVRAVALAILRNPAEAEDAAQEAFLRAFRRASGYRGEGPVGAWLCRIAVRCAHDQLRRSGRQRRLAEAEAPVGDPDEDAGTSDPDEGFGRRAELESALGALAADEREALVLKEVVGMTYREIADSTGAPLGTVQSRIHRARTRLAATLGGRR